jgi:hypothetical protein
VNFYNEYGFIVMEKKEDTNKVKKVGNVFVCIIPWTQTQSKVKRIHAPLGMMFATILRMYVESISP